MEFTDKCLPCVVHEFDTIFFIATLQTYKRHSIFHNENNISMVANQKHVYPNLQLFRKRKKLIYSAMPRYIVLKLINYGNHIL